MAIEHADVSIRSYRDDHRNVSATDFVDALTISEGEHVVADQGPHRSACVTFLSAGVVDIAPRDGLTPYQVLERRLAEVLQQVSEWLKLRPVGIFRDLAGKGFRMDLFLDLWIDQDQVELELPAELLARCGERGLSIKVITND